MSSWAYGAGALGLVVAGQLSGADLLDQALGQDMSVKGVVAEAGNLVGLGVSATDAAIIVAAAGLGYKVLQIAAPFFETINLYWRKRLMDPSAPGAHPLKQDAP